MAPQVLRWAWQPIFRHTIYVKSLMLCMHLLDNPKANVKRNYANIFRDQIIRRKQKLSPLKLNYIAMYETGNGSIRMRAVYQDEEDEIIITALPYQVSGAKVLEQIAEQMQKKKLPLVV